jgi:tetratricopeptide (TPR) repeat protein
VLRLLGFFVVVLLVLNVARHLPLVGGLFQIPLFGFWLAAILVSAVGSKFAGNWVDRRKERSLERQLGEVDTPHNLGKLGSLLLAQGRHARALGYLGRAINGEPDVAEWRYRAGCALLGLGRPEEAVDVLIHCMKINEGHAYGQVLLRLGQAYQGAGQAAEALEILERYDVNHGPCPESAYRRGLALKALGRGEEARAALSSVGELVKQAPAYQRRGTWPWVARAGWARIRP